jgi:hypothetical protein
MARRIKYYNVRHGRGFWEPTAKMRKLGFDYIACGEDGPSAWKIADDLNKKWDAVRKGERLAPLLEPPRRKLTKEEAEDAQIYPRGSMGEAFKVNVRAARGRKSQPAQKTIGFAAGATSRKHSQTSARAT